MTSEEIPPFSAMHDTVGVYYSGQDFSLDPPAFFIDRKTARQWLKENAAWSIHHGRDIALSSEAGRGCRGTIDARRLISHLEAQPSQVMGETVMKANAERERWAMRMTRSWHSGVSQAEHLRSLKRYQELNASAGAQG